jgi:hypothetical protein
MAHQYRKRGPPHSARCAQLSHPDGLGSIPDGGIGRDAPAAPDSKQAGSGIDRISGEAAESDTGVER